VSAATELLQGQFAALFAWERRKRHEQTLVAVSALGLMSAIILLPLYRFLPIAELRWWVPVVLTLAFAPYFFYRWRWRAQDATRALVRLDKVLRLDERATTAWELAMRGEINATAELVYKQAQEKLLNIEPQILLPRQWGWHAYAVAPLLALWLALVWFDAGQSLVERHRLRAIATLANKLHDFARELQEKAKDESLRESLKAGQELEKLAQKYMESESSDDQLKKELPRAAQQLAAAGKSVTEQKSFAAGESQQSLKDLKAELEAARDLFNLPDGVSGAEELPQQWLDRLTDMPQLKRQLDREQARGLGRNEMKSLLDRLNQQATGELDRRALLDAQQFLEQMMKGPGNKNDSNMQMAGRGEQEAPGDGTREKNYSNLPGREPGKKDDGVESLPEYRGSAQTHVKGSLGEGDSSGVVFKGKPMPGKSAVAQQDVVANYRRQAEQELNSERVPEALKETIRNYFLSLGEGTK
jgi:hypothetical protein